MNALAHPLVQETALASPGQIMAMAGAVAQELSARWPFEVTRVRVSLAGPVCRSGAWEPIVQAVLLGLSGIVDGDSTTRVDGALGFQRRMMAVRLAGRKLVSFHPARDLDFSLGAFGGWADRLRVDALGGDGRVLGSVERVLVAEAA